MLPQITQKLTKQEIFRVFMLYYGGQYQYETSFGKITKTIEDINIFLIDNIKSKCSRLLLKNLFDITESEVLELCKLVAPNEFGNYSYSRWQINPEHNNDSNIQQNIVIHNANSQFIFQFDLLDGDLRLYDLEKVAGKDWKTTDMRNPKKYFTGDCLEYKQWYFVHDYAVPLYPWGKNAFELGLAIDFRADDRAKGEVPSLLIVNPYQDLKR